MKRNFIIYILVLSTILGCRKEDNSIYKIKSITTVPTDYQLYTTTESFVYDSQERLTAIIRSTTDTTQNTYYQYNESFIVKQVPTDLVRKDTLYLNNEGLVVKRTDGIFEFSYEYDSKGFLIVDGNTISHGNVTERYHEYKSPEDNGYTEHKLYHYSKHENTIYYGEDILEHQNGNDNIGIQFWGKQNKNLLKNIEIPDKGLLEEFAYQFDSKDRVSKMEVTLWGKKWYTKEFEYYDQ